MENYIEKNSDHARLIELDSLEEERLVTYVQMVKYLDDLRRYYNRNVNDRFFVVEDLVLCGKQKTDGMHKLSSPWKSPFIIKATPNQVPTDYVTWTREMSQILGTSTYLDVSALEASTPNDMYL